MKAKFITFYAKFAEKDPLAVLEAAYDAAQERVKKLELQNQELRSQLTLGRKIVSKLLKRIKKDSKKLKLPRDEKEK